VDEAGMARATLMRADVIRLVVEAAVSEEVV
jgi:hypothetical protein